MGRAVLAQNAPKIFRRQGSRPGGELTALPYTPSWIRRPILLRDGRRGRVAMEGEGAGEGGRGREGYEGKEFAGTV